MNSRPLNQFRRSDRLSYQAIRSTHSKSQFCSATWILSFSQCSDFISAIAFVSHLIYLIKIAHWHKDISNEWYFKINLCFLKKNIQKNLLRKKWGGWNFVKKKQKQPRELRVYHLSWCTTPIKTFGKSHKYKFYLLDMNEETKRVFLPRPIFSRRSTRNISSYLVRAKLYSLKRVVDTFTGNVFAKSYKKDNKLWR